MARVKQRELWWEAPPDTDITGYLVYAADPGVSSFLTDVDAGTVDVFKAVQDTKCPLGEDDLPEGNWQFAVCSQDAAGNISDPYQHPAWKSVPLDLTAPGAPKGGGLRVI